MSELPSQLSLRFAGLKLRSLTPHGAVYTGKSFIGEDISLAVLSEPAATDAGLREAFAAAVRHHQQAGGGRRQVHSADIGTGQPWVAVRGRSGAEQILAALTGTAPPPPPHLAPPLGPPASAAGHLAAAPPAPSRTPGRPVPAADAVSVKARTTGTRSGSRGAVLIVAAVLVALGAGVAGLFSNRPATEVGGSMPPVAGEPPPIDELPVAVPALRDVTPVSVIGPTWQADDLTVTVSQAGWPFAFRMPPGWGCLEGTFDLVPDALAQQCIDLNDPTSMRVNIILWSCPTTCTEAEQRDMVETWLDHPDQAVRAEPHLVYVETELNPRGAYSVDLSHFTTALADPDGPLRWHVGIYVESPPETADLVLKVLNDIVSQTS